MYKVVDVIHGLDKSKREKRLPDPMAVLSAVIVLFLVMGFFFKPIAKWLF